MIQGKKSAFYYGWAIVFSGFMLMAVVFVAATSLVSLFIVPVCEGLNVSRGALSLHLSISGLAAILIAPYTGKLMARFTPRVVTLISVMLMACALFGFSISQNIYQFYIAAVLRGLALPCSTTAAVNVLVNRWFGPKLIGRASSMAQLGRGIGVLILMPLTSYILTVYGWRWGYRLLAVLVFVLAGAVLLFVVKNAPEEKGLARMGDLDTPGVPLPYTGLDIAEIKKTPAFWALVLGVFLFVIAQQAATHSVAYMLEVGIAPGLAVNIQTMVGTGGAFATVIIGLINDKKNTKVATVYALSMYVLTFALMFLLQFNSGIWPVYVLATVLGAGALYVIPMLVINAVFGTRHLATIIGFTTMASNLSGVVGPYLAGRIRDLTGSYSLCWLTVTILAAIGAGMVLYALSKDYKNGLRQPTP